MALLTRQLATALTGGIPLIGALDLVAQYRRFRGGVVPVSDALKRGASLEAALREARHFPEYFIVAVAAADRAGHLVESMDMLAAHYEEVLKMQRALVNQLVYPLCVVVIAIYIIPFAKGFFLTEEDFGPYARAFVWDRRYHAVAMGGGLGLVWLLNVLGLLRLIIDLLFTWVWPVGQVIRKLALARFLQTLGTLLGSGMTATAALAHAIPVTRNWWLERSLKTVQPLVRQGLTLSESLAQCRGISQTAQETVRIGEMSGTLADTLVRYAHQLRQEGASPIWIAISVVEVGFIVLLGLTLF